MIGNIVLGKEGKVNLARLDQTRQDFAKHVRGGSKKDVWRCQPPNLLPHRPHEDGVPESAALVECPA